MNKLNKKQKTLLIISMLIAAIVSTSYYVYSKNNEFLIQQENLNLQNADETESSTTETSKKGEENIADSSKELIKVHISGAVKEAGIVELGENSRIADAIEKAGGLTENAYTDEINLAYVLEDGIKIYIPTKEEHQTRNSNKSADQEENDNIAQNGIQSSLQSSIQNSAQSKEEYITTSSGVLIEGKDNNSGTSKTKETKININTANQEELETLPGIGESTALKIINYRNEHGKFKKIENIKDVSGIGESKFNNIKDLIYV